MVHMKGLGAATYFDDVFQLLGPVPWLLNPVCSLFIICCLPITILLMKYYTTNPYLYHHRTICGAAVGKKVSYKASAS